MQKLILRCAKYYWTYIGSRLFRKNRPAIPPPQRILITKFDRLGDFFLLTPFLQQLLKKKIEIVLISPSINKEIVDHLKLPLSFIPFDNSSADKFSELLRFVRKTSFSHALNLSMNIWGGFLVNQSKSTHKIGLLQEREHYVYKGVSLFYDKILSYPPDTHNFDVLSRVFAEITGENCFYPLIETRTTDNEWVVIHPFASWKSKRWPRFFDLIESLTERKFKVKVLGTSNEYQGLAISEKLRNDPSVSFEILSSVKDLMEHINNCTAFIGNDSGPAHYAALIGKPSTIIWGPGLFERIHAMGKNVHFCIVPVDCRPCRQKGVTCERGDNYCLQNVTVEMVLEKFECSLKIICKSSLS